MVIMLTVFAAGNVDVEAAITCGRVVSSITSCIGYVQRGGAVPVSCCDGVRSLNTATATTPNLQAACRCLTALLPSVGANPSLVNTLPGKCGINFPYKYSPSLDCSK